MALKDWAREMAQYNRWQNESLANQCSAMPAAKIHADAKIYFGSIHRTLNHILLVDVWFWALLTKGRFPGNAFDPDEQMYDELEGLREHRRALDEAIARRLSDVNQFWLDRKITVRTRQMKRSRYCPRYFLLAQMFNHATHHRSQITSVLFRRGIEYGSTDLPDCPYSAY